MKRDLPSGTVTFLFSDIEGSTRLLDELGADEYSKALAEHRRLIREACARFGGVEVDTQGDAIFVAFPTAPGAVEAAFRRDAAARRELTGRRVNQAQRLSPRQREILELVAAGKTNAEIAGLLWISPGTVRKHLENAYDRLGVHTRTGAVAAACVLESRRP